MILPLFERVRVGGGSDRSSERREEGKAFHSEVVAEVSSEVVVCSVQKTGNSVMILRPFYAVGDTLFASIWSRYLAQKGGCATSSIIIGQDTIIPQKIKLRPATEKLTIVRSWT